MNQEKYYTRRQFITDSVVSYKRNNPKEYLEFKNIVEYRKANIVSDFGELKKFTSTGIRPDEDSFRIAISIPSKLHNVLHTILSADGDGDFPKDNEEMHWFMRTFKEFTIPRKV